MRKALGILAAAVLLAIPGPLQAQLSIGPTVAFHEHADFGIGAMASAQLPLLATGVGVLGDFTFFFPDADNQDYWELNGNLTWDLAITGQPISPFVLGGLNIARSSVTLQTETFSNTEVGLNVGGGIRFSAGTLEPLVGLRAEVDGGEGVVIFAALPFSLGP